MFFLFPLLMGALMLIPGWIYFIVLLYFCWITVPNIFYGFRSQNDLMFTAMMPVSKKDMVKARISVIVILELLHIVIAMLYGLITTRLYTNIDYYFFKPSPGFWGLCFVMLAIFNLTLIPMYYKTAYKFGSALIVSITSAMLFAVAAQWLGIQNTKMSEIFNVTVGDHMALHSSILIAGIAIFIAFTWIAYRMAFKRFLKVEIQ
ncbi:hypothetical protein J2Z47_001117 [Cohnella thailandensis]|nr:hypothetical protein [Cohnella thailandensis]